MQNWFIATAGLPAFLLASVSGSSSPTFSTIPSVRAHQSDEVMLLTYNVQDLPWPMAGDRSDDLDAMGQRLKQLRKVSAAPQIIVLQEAFGPASLEMLKAAGYEHIAQGPATTAARPKPARPMDQSFMEARSFLVGENQNPALSSGLMIASDYPILSVAMTPFPEDACAGYDCLANKGVILVRLHVPGLAEPLEVTTTHLNAGKKSGAAPARHLYAHGRQVNALTSFVLANRATSSPMLIAGDFNVSHSDARLANLQSSFKSLGAIAATAMGKHKYQGGCSASVQSCGTGLAIKSNVPPIHTLDWHLAIPTPKTSLTPVERVILFGRERDGGMLSDHIGYAVRYRIQQRR